MNSGDIRTVAELCNLRVANNNPRIGMAHVTFFEQGADAFGIRDWRVGNWRGITLIDASLLVKTHAAVGLGEIGAIEQGICQVRPMKVHSDRSAPRKWAQTDQIVRLSQIDQCLKARRIARR